MLAWLHFWWASISTLFAIVTCGFAFWRGGKAEKYGAYILMATWMMSIISVLIRHQTNPRFDLLLASFDLVTLLAFGTVSLYWRRLWTAAATAFQLNAVASHFTMLLSPQIEGFSYLTSAQFWTSYAVVGALAFGIWEHLNYRKLGLSEA